MPLPPPLFRSMLPARLMASTTVWTASLSRTDGKARRFLWEALVIVVEKLLPS